MIHSIFIQLYQLFWCSRRSQALDPQRRRNLFTTLWQSCWKAAILGLSPDGRWLVDPWWSLVVRLEGFYLFVGQIEIIRFFLPLKFTFCWVKSPFWCGKQQLLLLNKSREIQDLVAQYPHIFPPSFRLANSIFAHWIHDFCWLNLIIVKFIDEHSISIFSPIGFGANPKKHAGEIPLLDAKTQYCGGVCFRLFSLFSQSFPFFSFVFSIFFTIFPPAFSRFNQFNPRDFPGGSLDQLVQHLGIGKLKQQKEW